MRRILANKWELLQSGAVPDKQKASGTDELPPVPATTAQLVRATFQPANELCRIPTTGRDRKRPRFSRALERRSPKGDDLHNVAPGESCNVVICCGNGAAFSLEPSAGIDSQHGARDHKRFIQPESAGSALKPSVRAGLGP